jgi:hypothetical protein
MSAGYYTYIWHREADGTPYYVGKGKGRRAFDSDRHYVKCPTDRSRITIQYWPDENTAFAFERYLIDFWGRKDLGTGCLRNLSDGGEGPSNPSEETRRKCSEGGKKGGRVCVENGWAATLGEIYGAKNAASGLMLRVRQEAEAKGILAQVRARQQQGKKNAENGHMSGLGKEWGPIQGRISVESGLLKRIGPLGGKMATHRRWHVKRGIVNPNCNLCAEGVI